jgi:hypothetical protein
MAYKKRGESPEVTKTSQRIDKIKTIVNDFDLGNGLTQTAYEQKIAMVVNQTAVYNKQLAGVDSEMIILDRYEKELADFSDTMLKAVGVKYGFDSIEYEKAGGTRKSDKKRSASSNTNSENAAK